MRYNFVFVTLLAGFRVGGLTQEKALVTGDVGDQQDKPIAGTVDPRLPARRKSSVMLPAIFLLLVFLPAASSAQTVTFSFSGNCNPCNLVVATQVGQVASDTATISGVRSSTKNLLVNGGSLQWTGTPATQIIGFCPPCTATYGDTGGTASITGTVNGVDGNNLLIASFQGGATSTNNDPADFSYTGNVNIGFINPSLLTALGLADMPNYGTGKLTDTVHIISGKSGTQSVTVTFTPAATTTAALTVSPGQPSPGEPVTLTATVTSNGKPVTVGTVTFVSSKVGEPGQQVLGTVQMAKASGMATLKLGLLGS